MDKIDKTSSGIENETEGVKQILKKNSTRGMYLTSVHMYSDWNKNLATYPPVIVILCASGF